MSIERNRRIYGDATLIGDDYDFFTNPPKQRALDLAWSEACPVGPDLVKPKSQGGRGAEVMGKRYGQVIFWFKYLTEELKKSGRDDLASQLSLPRPRLGNEPLGKHSQNWLPQEMNTSAFRPATGYILPRLLTEFLSVAGPDQSQNLQVALAEFDKTVPMATDDISLIVTYAENLAHQLSKKGNTYGIESILKRLLSTGKLHEDNLYTEYDKILEKTKETTHLSSAIFWLGPEEMDKRGIYQGVKNK